MSGFTKGPWSKATGGVGDKIRGIYGASGACIVRWGGIARPESEEGQANATLILAAPDILAAPGMGSQPADAPPDTALDFTIKQRR